MTAAASFPRGETLISLLASVVDLGHLEPKARARVAPVRADPSRPYINSNSKPEKPMLLREYNQDMANMSPRHSKQPNSAEDQWKQRQVGRNRESPKSDRQNNYN